MFLQALEKKLNDLVLGDKLNFLPELGNMQIWDEPLIGIADAADPLWEKLKEAEVVGPGHLSPGEWLPGARSVISWFLPFTERVRGSNRGAELPSKEWLYGRIEGDLFNNALRRFVAGEVESAGGKALAPALDKRFAHRNHRSNWSERHVAFIAGLGTFSLNRSLITRRGSAGRLGSVIVDLALAATPRPYTVFDEYCTKCGVCIRRCPPQAVTANGKDNERCARYLDQMKELFAPRYACGKCQTAVPCEFRIPGRERL